MFQTFLVYLCFFLIPSLHANDIEVIAQGENFKFFQDQNSVSSFSSQELNSAKHLESIIDQTPNLTAAGGSSRPRFLQIRGIGERSSYEGMPNTSVSILMDDIDYTGLSGILSTYGLESLEVYRGPQSSSKGPAALAGVIYAQTKSGAMLKGVDASYERASFNGNRLSLQGGLKNGKHEISLVSEKNLSDGFYENTYLQKEDTSGLDEESLRFKYILNLEQSKLIFNFHSFNFDNGYDVFNLTNSFVTRSDHPGRDRQYTNGLSLKYIKDHGPSTYTTIVSGHKTSTLYSYDEDWGNNTEWNNLAGWNSDYDYRIAFNKRIKTFTLEQNIQTQIDQFFFKSGLYFKHYQEDFSEVGFNGLTERKNTRGLFKRQSAAAYINADYQWSQGFSFFSGARIESFDSLYYDNLANTFKPSDFQIGAELGAKFQLSSTSKAYLKLARGYKTGGVNTSSAVPLNRKEFQDESLYSLEIGHIYDATPGLKFQTTLFAMFREAIQVKTSFQDNPSDPSSFTFYTDNAAEGTSLGLEHSSFLQFSKRFHFSLVGSLLKTSLGNYNYGQRNLKNREFAHAPEFTARLSSKIAVTENFEFVSSYFLQDNFYLGNSHDERAKSFQSLDLKLSYQFKKSLLSLGINNVFNRLRETRGFYFGNRPPSFSPERFVQGSDRRRIFLRIDLSII